MEAAEDSHDWTTAIVAGLLTRKHQDWFDEVGLLAKLLACILLNRLIAEEMCQKISVGLELTDELQTWSSHC